jgi:serine-type D-Ala-D-Ala endopeptidase (penicillin-binding protein 7)
LLCRNSGKLAAENFGLITGDCLRQLLIQFVIFVCLLLVGPIIGLNAVALAQGATSSKTTKVVKEKKAAKQKKAAVNSSSKKSIATRSNRQTTQRGLQNTRAKGKSKIRPTARAPIIPVKPSVAEAAGLNLEPDALGLKSAAALVVDSKTNQILFEKNSKAVLPIASLTKLMTALIVLESKQDLSESITVTEADIDREKNSRSRLPVGSIVSRKDLMQLALMASENRAASALSRNYLGGKDAFVAAMNQRAQSLGLSATQFADASGLSPDNTSTVQDLVKLTLAVDRHSLIREQSTADELNIHNGKRPITFGNSNRLVKNAGWDLRVQKTGFTSEAASCLVVHGKVDGRAVTIALLGAPGRLSKFGDAHRIREWLSK